MESEIIGFDTWPRTRIVFGFNALDRLGQLARELPAKRVLLVTDPGIVAAGHVDRAQHILTAAGVEVVLFDGVRENPTTRDVDNCLAVARDARIEAIIGLGGGSSLDTAKGCNFLLTNGGRMQDYWGVGKATRPMLPLIAVPTTAGTGSECQSFALIADEETHQKMACGDPKAAPRIALLDPTLTVSQPHRVTACTGMDAIVHAVETAVTTRRNEFSALYAREAFRRLITYYPRVLTSPQDLQARAHVMLGAAFAGVAIENSMLGAAHSAANPLTARYHLVHGHAVGLMLPHVVRFNAQQPEIRALYHDLLCVAGKAERSADPAQSVSTLVAELNAMLSLAGMRVSLREYGVDDASIAMLAQEAARQWTAQFNPRPIFPEDFIALYRAALNVCD
ncbi:MAG: iron-containing alcohol dehydrogenase [Chloroherpetonaceae bacterium]|nr:iron-containing alcohol dehydrogenase [Chthonomonadaceae bacterium]MDW8208779.1 iron-containing alcohol dehydrogenase [Chloroherpetonaceae bacterium]